MPCAPASITHSQAGSGCLPLAGTGQLLSFGCDDKWQAVVILRVHGWVCPYAGCTRVFGHSCETAVGTIMEMCTCGVELCACASGFCG